MKTAISRWVSLGLLALLAGCGGGGGGSGSAPVADTTPAAFTIPARDGSTPASATMSDPIVITGIDSSTTVAITGGEYSINNGPFTSAAGTISNGQTIRVRVTAPQQFSTSATAVLTVGGVSASFVVTTAAPDTTPDAFTFSAQAGAARDTLLTSNAVTVGGLNTPSPISIQGGEYSISGGAYTSAAGTVSNNQTIQVRLTSAKQFSTTLSAVLNVGGVSVSFSVTTLDADTTPDAFAFQRKLNATRDTWVTSNSVTISGIDVAVPISIENGEYSIDGGAYTTTAGTIDAGQSLTVRTKASAAYAKTARARVAIGTANSDFEVQSELPAYTPDRMAFDGQDVIYLLNAANKLVLRWSLVNERYLDAYAIGADGLVPTQMTYSSSHKRLYLAYSTGTIRYIDVTAAAASETPFASTPLPPGGLAAVGKYVLAQDDTGAWATHWIFDASGAVTDQKEWNYYSREYAWDPTSSRVYFFRDDTSPDDLQYEVIDQSTGKITSAGETPYHGAYNILTPIRVSANGQYVLLGSGDIYSQPTLNWSGSVGAQIADARWFDNGSMVTLTTSSNQTTLRRLGSTTLNNMEQLTYSGQALRVIGTDTKMAVLLLNGGTVQFRIYVPSDDSDGDGVSNTQDAFPLDAAASVDTDHDGYPDAWNAGKSQGDSTTGLSLDAYAQDSACYLPAHGDGVHCNYGATIPNYTPDQVVQDGDVIYLLSNANKRVYRWSISGAAYLNPYVVGIDQGFTKIAPTKIAYSSAQKRLYLGYDNGAIRYIDITAGTGAETPFANTSQAVGGLAAVGNYVLGQDGSNSWGTHYVFNSSGAITDQRDFDYYSREYAWDPVTSRVYFFRDSVSPNDLQYEVIDQTTGKITSANETPYHGSYNIQPPIRVSANGQYVLLGSGDLYNQAGLTWAGSVGSQPVDARWFANGSMVTLVTASNQTLLRRLGTNLRTLEQLTFAGQALRIVGTDTKMILVVLNNGTVQFRTYVPNDDSDGDGVLNTQDAFPLDAAASVDTDRDGYPDSWNAGKNQSDSTTGLTLDAYPQDAACYLLSHGNGTQCNYAATVPNYVPDQVINDGDTVYLLSTANKRVYRWSIAAGTHLNPYAVGIDQGFSTIAPTKMAYSSAHHRLYLGYTTGAIRYIDTAAASPAETPFANTAMGVGGLTSVGNFVLAQDDSGAWATHYVFNASGTITAQAEWNYYSREYAWDPVTSRVYFFRDDTSPNDLHYEVIDQTTGQISSSGETPYHGSYLIQPPIRVSVNGQYVLLGSGDLYNQTGLTWAGSLASQVTDARWFANGSLVALTTSGNQTTLRHLGPTLINMEQLVYTGQALRVVGSDSKMAVLTINGGTVQFNIYVPNNDSDNDGVLNTQDAFPLDPAASVDTDHDGYPDAWNAGKSQSDSTTGLTLDAYPQDAACYLLAHGDGVNCNYGATIPNYVPDQVINDGDTVYLLSIANHRVYRWSIATGAYLNPYIVGINQGFSTATPTKMAFSSSHHRLYLGYNTGAIQYIDTNVSNGAEVPFGNTATGISGLASVGNYVLAQDGSGAWGTHYVFNSSGVITDQKDWNYYSREYAWDPVTSRVYFFRDTMSPNDLHFEVINQTTGKITLAGETPYHGTYAIQPPIRVSPDGQYVLLGSGDIYSQSGLTWWSSLGKTITDAQWKGNLLVDLDTTDQVEIRDASTRAVMASYQYLGQPIRVVFGQSEVYLVHVMNGTTAFVRLPFYDQDNDTLPRWWEQLYGLSDSNAGDAAGDLDGDGVSNLVEYANHSKPNAADSDGDGLTDAQEIVTYATNPASADSDGDGLDDKSEVITYHTDPWDTDSDNDGYSDLDEVLYGGDPNDPSGLPHPITTLNESFESGPLSAAWSTPPQSSASWAIESGGQANTGSKSLRSGAISPAQQNSTIRFRGFFTAGQLSFYTKADPGACCERLIVTVDNVQALYMYPNGTWTRQSLPITLGVHNIEWRYERDPYSSTGAHAVWIDDLAFGP